METALLTYCSTKKTGVFSQRQVNKQGCPPTLTTCE